MQLEQQPPQIFQNANQGQGAVATTFAAAKDAAPSVDDLDEAGGET